MKALIGILMVAAFAVAASAQEAKVVAELAASTSAIKGQPFSADSVSESVQTLADGNRIVQSSTGKIYRNSDGKVRREMTGSTGGNTFFFNYSPGVSIAEPSGFLYLLDEKGRTARTVQVRPETGVRVRTVAGEGSGAGTGVGGGAVSTTRVYTNTERPLTDEQKRLVELLKNHKEGEPLTEEQKKAMAELKSVALTRAATAVAPLPSTMAIGRGFAAGENWFVGGPGDSKWDTKTDDLGTQTIEGLNCQGTRRTTTIPAGAIGNDRPIEIVYERWYSNDLQMVVSSKHSDPRFGEQTYTLKNIVRAEPDPSLFTVPSGFKVLTESGSGYTVRAAKPAMPAAATQAPKQP